MEMRKRRKWSPGVTDIQKHITLGRNANVASVKK